MRSDAALAWIYAWRGGVHRRNLRFGEAAADLDRAVRLDPLCFWSVAWRGELRVQRKRTAAGIADLKRALKLNPRYASAWLWLGQGLLEKSPLQARASYQKARRLEPGNVWAMIGEASCLARLGVPGRANALLSRARELAPSLFEGVA